MGTGWMVVTGAGSGIGRSVAALLAAAGHRVIGLDRATVGVPAGVAPLACDLTEPADVAAAVAAIGRRIGDEPVEGVAAVAGVPGTAPAATVHAVNVVGLRRFVTALVPHLQAGSALVLLSSMAGYRGPLAGAEAAELLDLDDRSLQARLEALAPEGPVAYALSKQLVHRLTVDLAARLHPVGVRAVSISPGPVETPILADFRSTMPSLDEATRLVGRNARPDEIAAVVAFALSPAASWLNGTDVRLDGGLTALREVHAPA